MDWSAAEGLEICKMVKSLKKQYKDPAVVNREILKKFGRGSGSGATWRSVQEAWRKGEQFWQKRLEQVEVGKHGRNKPGGHVKNVCRRSEAWIDHCRFQNL